MYSFMMVVALGVGQPDQSTDALEKRIAALEQRAFLTDQKLDSVDKKLDQILAALAGKPPAPTVTFGATWGQPTLTPGQPLMRAPVSAGAWTSAPQMADQSYMMMMSASASSGACANGQCGGSSMARGGLFRGGLFRRLR